MPTSHHRHNAASSHSGQDRRKFGRQVQPGGEFLSPAHFPTQGCGSQPVGHESASRAPHRHAPPRPGSGGHSPYIKQAPTTSAPRLPGGWTPCTLFPPAHSRNASPPGPLKPDSMDSTRPLGLLLLPLLLMGTALGNGAQEEPGIGGSGTPSLRRASAPQ